MMEKPSLQEQVKEDQQQQPQQHPAKEGDALSPQASADSTLRRVSIFNLLNNTESSKNSPTKEQALTSTDISTMLLELKKGHLDSKHVEQPSIILPHIQTLPELNFQPQKNQNCSSTLHIPASTDNIFPSLRPPTTSNSSLVSLSQEATKGAVGGNNAYSNYGNLDSNDNSNNNLITPANNNNHLNAFNSSHTASSQIWSNESNNMNGINNNNNNSFQRVSAAYPSSPIAGGASVQYFMNTAVSGQGVGYPNMLSNFPTMPTGVPMPYPYGFPNFLSTYPPYNNNPVNMHMNMNMTMMNMQQQQPPNMIFHENSNFQFIRSNGFNNITNNKSNELGTGNGTSSSSSQSSLSYSDDEKELTEHLALWKQEQKRKRKADTLAIDDTDISWSKFTPEQLQQLDLPFDYVPKNGKGTKQKAPGGVFDSQWRLHFAELQEFNTLYGHSNVTRTSAEWRALGNWVAEQRRKMRQGKLSIIQFRLLTAAGFEWDRSGKTEKITLAPKEEILKQLEQVQQELQSEKQHNGQGQQTQSPTYQHMTSASTSPRTLNRHHQLHSDNTATDTSRVQTVTEHNIQTLKHQKTEHDVNQQQTYLQLHPMVPNGCATQS